MDQRLVYVAIGLAVIALVASAVVAAMATRPMVPPKPQASIKLYDVKAGDGYGWYRVATVNVTQPSVLHIQISRSGSELFNAYVYVMNATWSYSTVVPNGGSATVPLPGKGVYDVYMDSYTLWELNQTKVTLWVET